MSSKGTYTKNVKCELISDNSSLFILFTALFCTICSTEGKNEKKKKHCCLLYVRLVCLACLLLDLLSV
jgi:hypothetical protein